jgi:hypothetical protein
MPTILPYRSGQKCLPAAVVLGGERRVWEHNRET